MSGRWGGGSLNSDLDDLFLLAPSRRRSVGASRSHGASINLAVSRADQCCGAPLGSIGSAAAASRYARLLHGVRSAAGLIDDDNSRLSGQGAVAQRRLAAARVRFM